MAYIAPVVQACTAAPLVSRIAAGVLFGVVAGVRVEIEEAGTHELAPMAFAMAAPASDQAIQRCRCSSPM